MRKYLGGIIAILFCATIVAFSRPEPVKNGTTKIYQYQGTDDSHVFDGISPYWVEVAPGNECDPIDPTLPCTVTLQIGSGSGEFADLDAFLDQFNSVQDLMAENNVTGKDE